MDELESIAEAVSSGDFHRILKAQQREIADAIPDERGPAKAALHRQLSLISKEIAELDAQSEGGDGAAETDDDEWDGEV